MKIDDSTISLDTGEVEMLLAALFHYEKKFHDERTESLSDEMELLRDKLICHSHNVGQGTTV